MWCEMASFWANHASSGSDSKSSLNKELTRSSDCAEQYWAVIYRRSSRSSPNHSLKKRLEFVVIIDRRARSFWSQHQARYTNQKALLWIPINRRTLSKKRAPGLMQISRVPFAEFWAAEKFPSVLLLPFLEAGNGRHHSEFVHQGVIKLTAIYECITFRLL